MNQPSPNPGPKREPARYISKIDPFDMDYVSYVQRVRVYNLHLQKEIKKSMEGLWNGQSEHIAIATSGSDGRLEKGPQSKMELILLYDQSFDSTEVDSALTGLRDTMPSVLWEIHEGKPLGNKDKPVSAYHGDVSRLYPTRLFDAELICGNPHIFLEGLAQQEQEVVSNPLGADCLKAMNERRRNSLYVVNHGFRNFKGAPVKHFDLEKGVSYYSNPHLSDGGTGSFKFGPLRAVQYRLAVDLIRFYRGAQLTGNELPFTLDDLPHNVPERLFWLEAGKFTPRSMAEINSLADNYCFFLHQYHKSQWNYLQDGKSETEFDLSEVKSRLKDTAHLLEHPIIEPTY